MSDNSTLSAELAPATLHQGFEVVSACELPEIDGCAYVMRHVASGARLLWLANADANKSFSIAFKTPPADDTGVFHILEHSVLCGSDAYPVKEPFVNLLKSSMQTFLNALTFPDKTMYPVASTSTADLENLMGVYLDAVLHPAIYTRPRIFEQEGWHLECTEDGGLAYNGVVFNEMKGALSDPDDVLYQAICRQLFPDTAYGFESGGNPRAIPTLSYENFLHTHARHYNLANSYTVLYGDLDIERELAFIGERFDGAAERVTEGPNPLALQAPVQAARSEVRMATAETNSAIGLSYVIGTATDRARVLAADVLLDALCGSNEAPLKRAVLDAGLADDFNATLVDGVLQPQAMFILKGLHEDAGAKFRALVESTCADLADNGIPRGKLRAALAQAEFNLREGDWGYPDGVALSMVAMSSWLYDEERPLDFIRYEDALAELKRGLDEGCFEKLLRELVCESGHSAEVELVPVSGDEGDAAEEAAELAARRSAMNDEQYAAVGAEVEALRAEQEALDSPEALATLPILTPSDIEPPAPEARGFDCEAPLPCRAYELPCRGICYTYFYFDLRRVAFCDLPYVGVLCDLLGQLGTCDHSASDLDTIVEENLGNLDFFCETYTRADDLLFADPVLVVGASALASKVDALATLPAEVWGRSRFDDLARIRDVLAQRKIGLEQGFVGAGHSAAAARVSACFSAASLAASQVSGVEYYLFLKELLVHWDERSGELATKLAELQETIFSADEMSASFIGAAADRERFWAAAGDMGLTTTGNARHKLEVPAPTPKNEAFVIPSNVGYVAGGSAPSALDASALGVWQVLTRVLSFDYLWNEVRVKGGAYGVSFRHSTNGLNRFVSFRDPAVDATLARYDGTAAWLAAWQPSKEELDGYIVATVAGHDAPVKPRQTARRQDVALFSGKSLDWRDRIREQELAATADELRGIANVLADPAPQRVVCVFGPREAIEGSKVAFDEVTELMA